MSEGNLGNVDSYNENSCGALSTIITLTPGETKEIAFILGMKENDESKAILASYADVTSVCKAEYERLLPTGMEDLRTSRLRHRQRSSIP